MRVTGAHRGNACYPLNPLAVLRLFRHAANYMPSVLFFNVVSVPRIGTARFELTSQVGDEPLVVYRQSSSIELRSEIILKAETFDLNS